MTGSRTSRLRCRATAWVMGLTVAAAAVPGHAQVNIETLRRGDTEPGWTTAVRCNFIRRTGSVDLTLVQADLRSDWNRPRTQSFGIARGDIAWKDGERFSNGGLVHVRHILRRDARVRPEALAQFDYDKSRDLDARWVGGAGLRFTLAAGPRLEAAVGTTYLLEFERYDLPAGARHERRTTAHRSSSYLSLRAPLSPHARAAATAYAQPRWDDARDLRVLLESSLGADLTGSLALTTSFGLRYDSRPPDEVDRLDTELVTGIRLAF